MNAGTGRRRADAPRREGGSAGAAEGADEIVFAIGGSSLGRVLVARSARGLRAVLLGDEDDALERDLRTRLPGARVRAGGAEMGAVLAEVIAAVERPGSRLEVPLDPGGTEFQRLVWAALREIPAGATASYTEIAERIGRPGSVRAVAGACGANPLAVVVPCHRVLRSDGGLSGYRWGVERKRMLLAREATGETEEG